MKRIDPNTTIPLHSDGNAETYRPADDARSAERVHRIPLKQIVKSPRQTRLVPDPAADHDLGEDIDRRGLTQYPVVTPDPQRPDVYVTVVGHRRLGQCWRLAVEGRGQKVLGGEGAKPGDRTVPVLVRDLDEAEAYGHTIAENLQREDLRPWEQVRAFMEHRKLLEDCGANGTVRGVADSLDQPRGTVGDYMQVGNALTEAVLDEAGVLVGGVPDHRSLCELKLAALLRAARKGTAAERARTLKQEVAKALGEGGTTASSGRKGFQVNIRKPLESLNPEQAEQYLAKFAPALGALLGRLEGTGDGCGIRIPRGQEELLVLKVNKDSSLGEVEAILDVLATLREAV